MSCLAAVIVMGALFALDSYEQHIDYVTYLFGMSVLLMYILALTHYIAEYRNNSGVTNLKRGLFLFICIFWGAYFVVLMYGFNTGGFKFMSYWGWTKIGRP